MLRFMCSRPLTASSPLSLSARDYTENISSFRTAGIKVAGGGRRDKEFKEEGDATSGRELELKPE